MNILGRHVRRSIGLLRSLVEAQERRLNNESQEITREQAVGFAKDPWSEEASGILLVDSSERAVMAIKNGTTGPATFPDLGNSSFWADVKDGITLPRTQHHVISAMYKNVGQYFKPKSVNRTVNSRIISATLVNTTLVNGNSTTGPSIDGNVTIVLEHTEQTFNGSTQCVFWDVFHGNWSGEGCTTATTNTTHTICECNHLTSFAILVDTTGQHSTIGEQHSFALSVITYIGCIISIVCLFFCICVFLGFRRVRCTRTIIHANLCICLLVAEVVFLAAVDKTENAVVCEVIAIVLHYLFLAVFTWMCVEGVELYVLLVKVFNLKMNRLIYYHLVGYGAPALVVAISVTYNYFVDVNKKEPDEKDDDDDGYFDGYGTDTYCWLSVNSYFIWSFVGPMLIVVLVNIGFLAMTMRVIYTQKAHDRSNQSGQGMEFKFWIRVSLALVCILGLTWVFGVLYISNETLVFAYVFTVINSLQVQDEIERRFGVRCPCWSKKKRQKTVKRQSRRTARAPQQQEIWLGDFTDTKDSHSSTHGSLQTNMSSEDTLDKLDDEGFVENSTYEDGAGTEGSVDNVIYEGGADSLISTCDVIILGRCLFGRPTGPGHYNDRIYIVMADSSEEEDGFLTETSTASYDNGSISDCTLETANDGFKNISDIDTDCEPNTTPQGDGITPLDDVTPLDYAFDDTYSTPPDYAITPPDYAFDDTYSTPPDYAITPPDYAFDDTYSTPPDYAITPPDYAFDDTYSTPPDYVITPPDYAFDDTYSTPPDYVITPPDYAFDDTYSTPPDYAITPPDDAITLPDYAITPPDDAITPPVDTGSSHRDMHENCTQNETSQWVCDFEKQRKQGVAPVEILSRVRERLVNATENIRGGDIHRSIRLLSRLVEDQEHRFSNNSQQMKKEEAIRFAEDHRSEVASGILDSSERAAILLARVVPYKTHWIANENIVMAIKNGTTRPATFPDLGNSSFWADVKDGITLPRTQHHVISAIYRNVGQYFKPKSVNRTVNSRIISATLVNTTLVNGNSSTGPSIDGNVTIVLEHTEQTSNGSTLCVFWDVFHGNWSGEGCTTATTNTTHTICECNHLTSFAILLDTTGQHSTIGEQHSFALSVITYIGCIISIVCLFFCICVFLGFRRVRCTRTIIHANLCICLLVAEVVFLAAVDKTENAVVCDVIAIVLHYLFLAVFTWMCVEGVELYVLLVKVFNLKMNRLIYYHLVGYVAWWTRIYLQKISQGCWLSVNNYFIWSFVGPMLIVVLVNVGFLAMTMRVIYTQKAHDRSNQSEQGMEFKFWIRVSLALVCILGLTWVFGVLYISSETLVFAYVFTVINSLQVQDEIERRFGVRCPCWSKKKRQKTAKRQSRRTARAPQQQEIWLGDFTDTKDSHSSTHGSLQTNMSSEDTLDKLDDEGFVENSIYEDGAGTEGSVDNVIYKAGGPA
ncbi:hypothetical protein Bbelb_396480 [Branchiostoma belcheri]|nr:hypothetical protein Bbelb_396480 [Branchiostoma belcheri]